MQNHADVPLMYQAQVEGRSQIQRLIPGQTRQQAYDWVYEWIVGCDRRNIPTFAAHIQTKTYRFTWRMVTNSGQDAGVIRPVIGERGWAYFPGSSMKGAFLRACKKMGTPEEVQRYCGGVGQNGELHPGILRFHGGYPSNDEWLDNSLVDIAHPQEDWQVKDQSNHSAFIQITLYEPEFLFGLSSAKEIRVEEWERIWQIWEAALGRGIGSRVSAGYGQTKSHSDNRLLAVWLNGQGLCSKRINNVGEFRPNGFKATLRGHTRRLFSGVADDATVEALTKKLWGGFAGRDGSVVGLLGVACNTPNLDLDVYHFGNNNMPVYDTGDLSLNILLMKDVSVEERMVLGRFVAQLLKFSMLLGGFGKSWRRIDHRLFFPNYLNNKPMIGCHWSFAECSHKFYIPVGRNLANVTLFLDTLQANLAKSPLLRKVSNVPSQGYLRESWQKGNVEVWGRIAKDRNDSLAVRWFHGNYQTGQSIYRSELTGRMGKISRIWHRMYPQYRKRDGQMVDMGGYIELLTIFPNRDGDSEQVQKTANFLEFLRDSGDFIQLW